MHTTEYKRDATLTTVNTSSPRIVSTKTAHKKMHITVSWEGAKEVVEVDEGCRSVAALLETVAAALPELDAETVCLEIGGCAADDEAVCGLCEGCVVTVAATPAALAAATLREEGWVVDSEGFRCAARDDDVRRCRLYLTARVCDPGECEGNTPLDVACQLGHLVIIELLLNSGYSTDKSCLSDKSLRHACTRGQPAVVKVLLDSACPAGAECVPDDRFFHCLHIACDHGHAEIVELLLGRGCPIDEIFWCQTLLQRACAKGHAAIVKLLLGRGCASPDTDASFDDSDSPLHRASANGHPAIVKILLDHNRAIAGMPPLPEPEVKGDDVHALTPLQRVVHKYASWSERGNNGLTRSDLRAFSREVAALEADEEDLLAERLDEKLDQQQKWHTRLNVLTIVESLLKAEADSATQATGVAEYFTENPKNIRKNVMVVQHVLSSKAKKVLALLDVPEANARHPGNVGLQQARQRLTHVNVVHPSRAASWLPVREGATLSQVKAVWAG